MKVRTVPSNVNRKLLGLVVALVVVGVTVAPSAAWVAPAPVDDGTAEDPAVAAPDGPSGDGPSARSGDDRADGQASNGSVTAGQRLSGVVAVQDAEVAGEMGERAYAARIASTETDAAKAAVVADRLEDAADRLATLRDRKERLQKARENGSISDGEYRSRIARLAAEIRSVERLVNASERTAQGLPADVLAEKGVDADAIRTLRDEARDLSGPEVAEIAQSIAGKGAGRGLGEARGSPSDPPGQGADGTPGAGNNRTTGAGNGDDPGQGEAGNRTTGPGAGDGADRTTGAGAGTATEDGGTATEDGGTATEDGTTTGDGTTTDDGTTTSNAISAGEDWTTDGGS
ncbi:hypothetical protein BRD00_10765 [Halobacteriales archaeon QS_8_69_26]|nr:MAG: hypothetical protein BRD00_10765 [Halobacteriales archaeon QS_8_69_26]